MIRAMPERKRFFLIAVFPNGYTHIHVSIRTGSSNINVTSIKTEITEKNNKRTQFPDRKRQTAEIAGVALLPSFVAIFPNLLFFSCQIHTPKKLKTYLQLILKNFCCPVFKKMVRNFCLHKDFSHKFDVKHILFNP